AGDLAGEVGDFESIDLPRAALTVEDGLPRCVNADAEPRNHAQPRDDNPSHVKTPARDLRPKTRNRGTVPQRPVRLCLYPPGTSAFRVLFEKLRRVAAAQNLLSGVIGSVTN